MSSQSSPITRGAALAVLAFALILLPSTAWPQLDIQGSCGDVIRVEASYPVAFVDASIGESVHGLAFGKQHLWVAIYGAGEIHRLGFTATGELISELSIPAPAVYVTGITFHGGHLFATDDLELVIARLKTEGPKAGMVKSSFYAPGHPTEDSVGLTFARGHLYNADFYWSGPEAYIHKISLAGHHVQSYPSPGECPEGLAFDGKFLWHADLCTSKLYRMETEGTVVCEWDWQPHGQEQNPIGLTFDGENLWLADNANQTIYRIDINPG